MGIWRYALIGVAMVASAQQDLGKGVNFYSLDKEIALGANLAKSVDAKTTPLDNAAASAYVDRIVQRLAAQIPDSKFKYKVTVVQEPVGVEPTALPGGHIYVSAGQFTAAHSESEFVGLLAHAMSHVANRDYTRLATKSNIAEIATMPFLSGDHADMVKPMTDRVPFRNSLEMEADWWAVKMMAAAGYYPGDLAQYIERTGKDDGTPAGQSFQKDRLTKLRQSAAAVTVVPSSDGLEFERVRAAAAK
jgi:predicted Zn-dependent protease